MQLLHLMLMKDSKYCVMSGLAVLLLGGKGHRQCLRWEVSYNALLICLCWSLDHRVLWQNPAWWVIVILHFVLFLCCVLLLSERLGKRIKHIVFRYKTRRILQNRMSPDSLQDLFYRGRLNKLGAWWSPVNAASASLRVLFKWNRSFPPAVLVKLVAGAWI